MALYALVDGSGAVVNAIIYDGQAPFEPPSGMSLVLADNPRVSVGWTHGPNGFVAPVPPPAPAPTLAERQAALAAERYAKQISGVMFQAAGATVPSLAASDPASTGLINGSYAAARDGHWVDGTPWKMTDGTFVPLTAADMIALALRVLGYIAACYGHEAQLSAALASDLTTDITAGWPANT